MNGIKRPCAQTYHFTTNEWAHGILLVASSKVEVFYEGCKKPCFLQLLSEKPIRDFNLSHFREIEPDQVKVCLLFRREKMLLNWGSNPCHKVCCALRAC